MVSTLAPGTLVGGRFEVGEVLGAGGFATVYAARHVTLGSHHAIKVLTAPTDEQRARLVAEGNAQAQLRHANILRVTDVVEVGEGDLALVMDFVQGPTMARWLTGARPDLGDCERIGAAVLSAMGAAHAAGLVHRDLKPDNILLEVVDGVLVPWVADFGLVRAMGAPKLTRDGISIGTPLYMAPEQWQDLASVDARADVFALGAILYELVAGRRLNPGRTPTEVMAAAAAGLDASLHPHRPDAPEAWSQLLLAMVAPSLTRRPASAEGLAEVWRQSSGDAVPLHTVANTVAFPAEPAPEPETTQAPPRSRRGLLAGGAAVLAAAGLWAALPARAPTRGLTVLAEAAQPSDRTFRTPVPVPHEGTLTTGQHVRFAVRVSVDSHVSIWVDTPDGIVRVWPESADRVVPAGEPLYTDGFELTDGPSTERFLVVASDAVVDAERVAALTPGVGERLVASNAPGRGVRRSSDAPRRHLEQAGDAMAMPFTVRHTP